VKNLKSTGITRPVDNLGRIVLPMELRRTLGIVANEDRMEIFVDGGDIILRKFVRGCTFCGETKDLKLFSKQYVCKNCRDELRKELR